MGEPVDTPVTTPEGETVAEGLLLVHTPPGAASLSATEDPIQTVDEPDIVPASGKGSIVMSCVAKAVPQPLVTV